MASRWLGFCGVLTGVVPAQVALHPVDLTEAGEQPRLLLRRERTVVPTGLDRLAQPDALLVVGDVLDLVGDRAAVDLPQARVRLGERLTLHVEPQQSCR